MAASSRVAGLANSNWSRMVQGAGLASWQLDCYMQPSYLNRLGVDAAPGSDGACYEAGKRDLPDCERRREPNRH